MGLLSKISSVINLVFSKIEGLLAPNWFNPFATLYFNLRSFSFEQAIRFPVYVFGHPRFLSLSGKMIVEGQITAGMIVLNKTLSGVPSNTTCKAEIENNGLVVFKGCGSIGTGVKIRIYYGASLEFGRGFKIMDMINIGCYRKIIIGEFTWITHRCQILDTDYHYILDIERREVLDCSSEIVLGDYCWIGNTSTILKGTILPNCTIVGSNSLLNKDYRCIPTNSLIAGIPAKLIKTGVRRVDNQLLIKDISWHYKKNKDNYRVPSGEDTSTFFIIDYYIHNK